MDKDMKKDMDKDMKDPMDKNGLGENLPSKNDTKGKETGIHTAAGSPVDNNQDTMTAGERGPTVLQDLWMIEKNAHFNREVIPERRMHAKGWGGSWYIYSNP